MVCESKVSGSLSEERCLEKAWAHRNGGTHDSMGAFQGPPGFSLVEGEVTIREPDLRAPTNDVYGDGEIFTVTGIRHKHVYGVDEL
jgi:hypothetical protein